MEMLNLATREKQDAILSNFPISGGTDFAQYNKHFKISNTSQITTLSEVLNITGEGYLMCAVITTYSNNTVAKFAEIKITADNEVLVDTKVETGTSSGGRTTGFTCLGHPSTKLTGGGNTASFITEGLIINATTSQPWSSMYKGIVSSDATNTVVNKFPYTLPEVLKVNVPIFFEESLVIQARSTRGTAILITGGVK